FAIELHGAFVSLDQCLHDCEAEATRVLLEDFVEEITRYPCAVIAHPALDRAVNVARADADFTPRRMGNRVIQEVLEDAPQETGVGEHDQIIRHHIHETSARGSGDGLNILDDSMDERPEIKGAPFEFEVTFDFGILVLLEHLAYQCLEPPHVALQSLDHRGAL